MTDHGPKTPVDAAMLHENGLVEAFVLRDRQSRAAALLPGRRRKKVVANLAAYLDPSYMHRLLVGQRSRSAIEAKLRSAGATNRCFVISEHSDLDSRDMLLSEALEAVVGTGLVTLISCIPGKLAYFEDEAAGARYILERAHSR